MTAARTITVPMDDEVMDFSSERKSLKFRIDSDVFEAAPDIAAELAIRFGEHAMSIQADVEDAKAEEQIAIVHELIKMVLFPESAERFITRLSDPTNPIGNGKVNRVIEWLFEEYGLRPTKSDSVSSAGPENPDAGTNLTVST